MMTQAERMEVLEREHQEFYNSWQKEKAKHDDTKEQLRRHDAWLGQAHVLCCDLGVKPGHIEDRLFEAIGAVTEMQNLLIEIFAELDDANGEAPYHSHQIFGIWDSDNGDLAGKPCEWCATWAKLREMVTRMAAPTL